MRILLINTVATDKNGITMVIFNYLRAMDTGDVTVDLMSINEPDLEYVGDVKRKGGHVYVLPRSRRKILSYWNKLRRLVKRNKYDVVHIHGNSHTVVLELSAIYIAGCKVRIVHSHNTTCTHTFIHKCMTYPFKLLCTSGVACGIEAGRWMFGNLNFEVINNGVDVDLFSFRSDARKKILDDLGWSNCKVVGHVGSFNHVKNQSFIVDVFDVLYKQNNSYRLLFIGEGDERKGVKDKVDKLGLSEFVKFTGNINNVHDYVNAMDLVVMPSLYEGLPLSLIEQQANGLQCIVSDTITKEVNKTGNLVFLSLQAPITLWADTILSLNISGREERSKTAISEIEKCGYSIQVEAEKLKGTYKRLLRNAE